MKRDYNAGELNSSFILGPAHLLDDSLVNLQGRGLSIILDKES